jgi:hypothetical protein
VWRRVKPLPGYVGLLDLHASDRLWHLLVHCTLHHPDRRGRLRDLFLLSEVLRSCSRDTVAEVHERAWRHECAHAILALLNMAAAIAEETVPPDPFRVTAAAVYIWRQTEPRISGRIMKGLHQGVWYQMGGRTPGTLRWTGHQEGLDLPSRFRAVRAVQRRWPSAGRHLRLALRTVAMHVWLPVTLILIGSARRAVAEMTRRTS